MLDAQQGALAEILPTLLVPFLFPMDRMMRDEFVRECKCLCKDPKSREEFLKMAEQAYGRQLDKELRAQLLLSYHKDPSNKDGFISNNKRHRRGKASSKEK